MVHSQAVTPNEALPVGITIIGVVQAHRVLATNQLGSELFHWFRFQNFLCNANACKEKLVIKSGDQHNLFYSYKGILTFCTSR